MGIIESEVVIVAIQLWLWYVGIGRIIPVLPIL